MPILTFPWLNQGLNSLPEKSVTNEEGYLNKRSLKIHIDENLNDVACPLLFESYSNHRNPLCLKILRKINNLAI